jgi:translocator protein
MPSPISTIHPARNPDFARADVLPSDYRLGALVGLIGFMALAALGGAFFPPDEWYQSLIKAPWNPPDWVFGPAWSLLYILTGTAAWVVLRREDEFEGGARVAFCVQWMLNALWTPVFFGLRSPWWALAVIVLLLAAVIWTSIEFARRARTAGWLMLPYVAWVTFALSLNAYIATAN